MDGFVVAFAVVGIIVGIISVGIILVWAVCFFVTIGVKTFKYNVETYSKVQKEHIEAKGEAKKARLAKKREQDIKHKNEQLDKELESKEKIFQLKQQERDVKLRQAEARAQEDLNYTKNNDKVSK